MLDMNLRFDCCWCITCPIKRRRKKKILLVVLVSAENVARQWTVTRQEQDEFALQSQQRCEAAQNAGHFDQEIVPVIIQSRTGT